MTKKDMEQELGWHAHHTFETWAMPFEEKYQMVDMVMIGDTCFAKNKTRKQEVRHCIFCNNSYPDTTFKNAAHLLPRMMGNTNLYSTFECDSCNNKFSLLETDLASFLGVGRSITGMQGNRKIPGFAGIGLEAKSMQFKEKKVLVIHKENAGGNFVEGTAKLKYLKPTYIPANIYKLFLKCALSVLPQEEVISDYQLALEYLRGEMALGGSHINIFWFPLTVKMPLHVYIFRKKVASDKLPVHVVSFYFDNLVITVPVLLHQDDIRYMNQTIELPTAPPYFVHTNDLKKVTPTFSRHDLSSPFKLKADPEEITMQFSKCDLENATRFDPKTGMETQTIFNPVDSKYFIATEEGTAFTKDELTELARLIELEFSKSDHHS